MLTIAICFSLVGNGRLIRLTMAHIHCFRFFFLYFILLFLLVIFEKLHLCQALGERLTNMFGIYVHSVCVCVEIWKVLSWKFKKVIETTYTMSDKYMATYVA